MLQDREAKFYKKIYLFFVEHLLVLRYMSLQKKEFNVIIKNCKRLSII